MREDLHGTFFCAAISGTGSLSEQGNNTGVWRWKDGYGNDLADGMDGELMSQIRDLTKEYRK